MGRVNSGVSQFQICLYLTQTGIGAYVEILTRLYAITNNRTMDTPYFIKVRISGRNVKKLLIGHPGQKEDDLRIGGETFKVIAHSKTRYNAIEVLPVGLETMEEKSQWCIMLAKAAKRHEEETEDRVIVEMLVMYS